MPFVITHRFTGGVSVSPFDRFNLATHVGDDPSAVAANRTELMTVLGRVGVTRVAWMDQVHGDRVAVVDERGDHSQVTIGEVDALVTTQPGLGLAVLVADCAPVVLRDDRVGVVAVVHAGRRGLAANVVAKTLGVMRECGATDPVAHIGPSICGRCYEVPAELADEIERAAPGSAAVTRRGTPGVDLASGLTVQLEALGVAVKRDPRCTWEDPQLFSYRREARTGRFAVLAWLA